MNKIYIKPSTEVINITTVSMIATSDQLGLNSTDPKTDETKLLSRRGYFWDDEEDY